MNQIAGAVISVVSACTLLLAYMPPASGDAGAVQVSAQSPACEAREYRQFDFWVGDWDVFEPGNASPIARVRVDRILDGCVLREQYEDTAGQKGQSFSIYDASRKLWHQSWVTNHGRLLVIEGNFVGGSMVLRGEDRSPDGKARLVRGVWKPLAQDVRESAVRSTDGGKSWQLWFDLTFRPHKP